MSDNFYRYNYYAVLLGGGKSAFFTAISLYKKYRLKIYAVDSKFGAIKFLPFVKCISSKDIKIEEFLVSYISSLAINDEELTPLLYITNGYYKDIYERNKEALSEVFLSKPELVFE